MAQVLGIRSLSDCPATEPCHGARGARGITGGGADRTSMLYVFCELQRVDDLGQFVDMTYL